VRIYRSLLVLYPRAFRREYAAPMAQAFGDLRRDRGRRAWLRTVPDLIRSVPPLRIEAVMSTAKSAPLVVSLALVVLGGAVLVMGFNGFGPLVPIVILGLAGAVYLWRHVATSVRGGGRAPLRHAVVQTWWAPVAALIGVVEVVFAIGTVFEASNWGGRIIGSSVMLAFGAMMLFGLTRRPFAREAGNSLILLATLPAVTFFWVIVAPVLALVVWVGVISSGFSEKPVATA
jgi:hypothetical protein